MRICLVDDDATQLDYLKVIIDKWAYEHNVFTELSFYYCAEEMLFENNQSYPFDMIILDVQMGKMNGIELAKTIREYDKKVIIAFVSGMADYVFDGYEVQAVRYILKPINDKKVYELLDFANTQLSKENKYLIISVSGEKKKLNYDDIIYIESMGHYTTFHLAESEYDYKYNIGDLCEDLTETEFIRTHRSYVVNMKHVEKITKNECHLIHNIIVPLSRNSYKSVNEKFIQYYAGKNE
jgi:DNA-binding LytR/AlgR family response regulator